MAIQNLTSSAALCGLNERLLREMAQVFLQRWIKDKKLILFDKKNLNDDCYVPMLRLYVYRYEAQGPLEVHFKNVQSPFWPPLPPIEAEILNSPLEKA